MSIPKNITKEHILKAIIKIDSEGIPPDGESRYYDVVYNGKKYPPKLIVSLANIFANGAELNRNSFEGGLNTPCFNLLEANDFNIIKKTGMITEKIKSFSKEYKKEHLLPHSKNLESFKILVNELPIEMKNEVKDYSKTLKFKGSIGQGVNTNYPWLGIFDKRVSTGATNGFYIVLLFSDDFEDLYLTLNQGSTIQTPEQIELYRNFVYSVQPSIAGFIKGRIPSGGLVKNNSGSATKNGKKYEETNIFFKKYEIKSIDEADFVESLKSLIKVYQNCAEQFQDAPTKTPTQMPNSNNSQFLLQESFHDNLSNSGIIFNSSIITRFISSLLTKPFVILTGLSGSGKTKLAHAFALWICQDNSQYCIVPVGADWTNREPLLGFPNALEANNYKKPDNKVLEIIINANKYADRPYFIILDEMNLSHVERYFSDFLSVMESKSEISLHNGDSNWDGVPAQISFPKNLFIIGTVNIDETTYMFSPKVLDRANVIEFGISENEMEEYLEVTPIINLESLAGGGIDFSSYFVSIATDVHQTSRDTESIIKTLLSFFKILKKAGAQFGYRSASEILRFAAVVNKINPNWKIDEITDAAIMQKLLPKIHGSRRKLEPILKILGTLCLKDGQNIDEFITSKAEIDFNDPNKIKYSISFEKILRMYHNLVSNGFTSYAEA